MANKQIVHWTTNFDTLTATEWFTLFRTGALNGATLEPVRGTPWSVAGTFSNLKVTRAVAPGSGKAQTYTVYKNGSSTGLTVTITDPATSASDITHTVSVSAGDTIAIQKTTSGGTPAGAHGSIILEFSATSSNESGYCKSPEMYVPSAVPLYDGLCFVSSFNDTGVSADFGDWSDNDNFYSKEIIPVAGTLTRFDIKIRASGLTASGYADFQSGDSCTFVIVKNGIVQDGTSGTVNTTMTLTHPTTSATFSGSLVCAAGDVLKVKATPNASMVTHGSSGTLAYAWLWSWCYSATATDQFWLGSYGNGTQAASNYGAVAGNFLNTTTESQAYGYGAVSTFYVTSLQATGDTGSNFWRLGTRVNAATPATSPATVFGTTLLFAPLSTQINLVALATAVSPGGSGFATVTSSDTWDFLITESTQILGSTVFGAHGTVNAPLAMLINLDGTTRTHNTTGKVLVGGDLEVTGTITGSVSSNVSADLDALGT